VDAHPLEGAPVTPASRWTTPRRLRVGIGAIWAAAAMLFLVGAGALVADRAALRAIVHDTAPSIVTAQELGAQLADLDAQLATSLLGSAQDRDVASELFELRRSTATRLLVDAAHGMTRGDAERIPIVVMAEELGRYLELASRAQWLYLGGDRGGALDLLRLATSLMHARILPAAGALDTANRDHMDAQYAHAQHESGVYEGEAFAAGALLVAVLVAAQVFVLRRMRRRVVPALLLATFLTVVFTSYLVGRFRAGRESLRAARDDAFNSIHLLWRARSIAYDASGDQSRWLLDRDRAVDYEAQYRQKLSLLVSRPSGEVSREDVRSGRVTGLLVDEANNVTFAGEADGVDGALAALATLTYVDDRMRQLERDGKHAEAVEVCVGSKADESRGAFDRFEAALERTIGVNQRAFDGIAAAADRGLRRAEWLDPAFVVAIALLGWLGIRSRLREYA
jgi:hypothetical protein